MEMRVERARRSAIGTASGRVAVAEMVDHDECVGAVGNPSACAASQQRRRGFVVGQVAERHVAHRRLGAVRIGAQQRR